MSLIIAYYRWWKASANSISWSIQRRAQDLSIKALPNFGAERRRRTELHALRVAKTISDRKRLFIDVSVVARHDAGTGIQRIVRAIALQLLENPPKGWSVHILSANKKKRYHQISWPSKEDILEEAYPSGPEDIFLGLDFALDTVRIHGKQLISWKRQGVTLWFVIYDLLPDQQPIWFSSQLVVRFRRWLKFISVIADGFLCISPPVASDLQSFLNNRYGISPDMYRCAVIPMGWDMKKSKPTMGLPNDIDEILAELADKKSALMVGTLEPRKGHVDILNAFEALWARGKNDCLVIVGRSGWKMRKFERRIRLNSYLNKYLFWFNDASDEALGKLYNACSGVIVASHGEGYGLPIIEALGHGKPILARDIPVFRMHESSGLSFFSNATPAALSHQIELWLSADQQVTSLPNALPDWNDSAQAVISNIDIAVR